MKRDLLDKTFALFNAPHGTSYKSGEGGTGAGGWGGGGGGGSAQGGGGGHGHCC